MAVKLISAVSVAPAVFVITYLVNTAGRFC
jgi:hypothetical protein